MTGKPLPSEGGSYIRKPRGGLERQDAPAPSESTPAAPADGVVSETQKETK